MSVLQYLQAEVENHNLIVISAITYTEMRYKATGKRAAFKHNDLVDKFVQRMDAVLLWDLAAVDETVGIKQALSHVGTAIGSNDTAIAGHAISANCVLMTNNVREFKRIPGLNFEDLAESSK